MAKNDESVLLKQHLQFHGGYEYFQNIHFRICAGHISFNMSSQVIRRQNKQTHICPAPRLDYAKLFARGESPVT